MQFKDIEMAYTRAWQKAFEKKRLLMMFLVLSLCGLCIVASLAMASVSPFWLKGLFYFLPLFLIMGLLLSAGIFFARTYYHEVKDGKVSYRGIFAKSLSLMISLSQVSLPFILSYLVVWIFMGLFFLLGEIPYIGPSITLLLSFAPFILSLSMLLLATLSLFGLFFGTAYIAFNKLSLEKLVKPLLADLLSHLFSYCILFVIALIPLALMGGLTFASFKMIHLELSSPLQVTLAGIFLMLPVSGALCPALLFFFNFSVESYNLVRRLKFDQGASI